MKIFVKPIGLSVVVCVLALVTFFGIKGEEVDVFVTRAPRAGLLSMEQQLVLYPLPYIINAVRKVYAPVGEFDALTANDSLNLPVASQAPTTQLSNGQIVVINGQPYLYDGVRGKWLTISRQMVWAARDGAVTNAYLNTFDGISTRSTGYTLPADATITGMTVASNGNTWLVASVGGDFATLSAALASPSVVNGDTILIAPETFTIASQINVSKSVTIRGCGTGATIQTAGTAVDPVRVLNITVGNVVIKNLTVKQRKTTNTSIECSIQVNAPGATGIVIDGITTVETMEFGIIMSAAEWSIENCELNYVGPTGNTNRLIAVSGNNGNSRIVNNRFTPSTDAAPGRTIFCLLTGGATYSGSILMDGNVQLGTGALRQFMLQEDFTGPLGGFELYISNNQYLDYNGGIISFGSVGMLNLFSSIVVVNNVALNNSGKGLVTLDGFGAGVNPGSTSWVFSGNTLINPGVTAPGFADATGTPGLIGYNTSVFIPLSIAYSTIVPPPPAQAPRFTLQARINGCPTVLASLPVFSQSGATTSLNVDVDALDQLQFYLDGTAYKPTAGIEYAYRA
ncbi:TPA: hypothetical protein DDZ86_05175 [Candidatus Dependentiae bacterium]|nr:hypothetical protein [Candidatus Dependentiae bacterium]